MRRILSVYLWWTLCATFVGCACAQTGGRPGKAEPIRAVWVDCWGPGLYTREQCDEMLAWVERYGFNTVLAEVRKVGDAFYRSSLEPPGLREDTKTAMDMTFDPLAYLVQEAKQRRGLRLEAWIVANRVWNAKDSPPDATPAHIVRAHPEWLLVHRSGRTRDNSERPAVYIDPSDPDAVRHTVAVAAEIASNYAVDAVHLDYVRYPGKEWGYGARSLARYRTATGRRDTPAPDDAMFVRWRAQLVTAQVRAIRDAIRAARPGIELTAATVTWGTASERGYHATRGYLDAMQDWPAWCDQGLIDVNYLMHYKREHDRDQRHDYRAWFPLIAPHRGPGKARIVIGQAAYLNSPAGTAKQMADALAAGFDGVCAFSYRTTNHGTVDREAFGRAVRSGAFVRR